MPGKSVENDRKMGHMKYNTDSTDISGLNLLNKGYGKNKTCLFFVFLVFG